MTVSNVGRPKRSRPTTRKNYVLDTAISDMIADLAELDGRTEGSEVEYCALIYAAIKRMTPDDEPFTFAALIAKANEIKAEMWKPEGENNESN
ncbi:hypothetical protein H6F89_00055 [Cyanobacteria bacterium FACHB-63]|nr:hypothetical protein [Cyanobacteria bacterium FACHB-63]